ncbi:Arylsulfatase [Symmachiella dynata]|uniref:sulfatase family protein n=1 Tax=Symmachiella dynata TaxID=2527995 RepID=UPI00118D45A7|nr:sulfatase [Symmachiella dynata]QDT47754.1 Arylsulfatase [Symmachiella dynata]
MLRHPALLSGFCALTVLFTTAVSARAQETQRPPNVVIIFTDDQGYADVGCFGAEGFETPHLDRMAAEGMRFTNFYVAQAVCGASRAALLTGCYPNRIGMLGAPSHRTKHGIHDDELLIPELLKQRDYATAIYGKWHLGHHEQFLPPNHGFDDYYGLPYSNDMWPNHPTAGAHYPPLPLIAGTKTIEQNPDQTQLTTAYTQHAVKFINQNKDRPFFLYVPHSMPHVPLFVSDKYKDKTAQGRYGDVISEIDWSVGQILEAINKNGLDDNTLVIFTSDNGPWLSYGNHGGSAGPLREGKGTTWEGGVREPCIMRWPGKIPAGTVCDELAATIDILPTLAGLTKTELPKHPIDGKDIWPLMSGEKNAKTPHEAYYYYWGKHLQAIRSGQWKLHFPHEFRSLTGSPGKDGQPNGYTVGKTEMALYDLANDIGETTDVKDQHPEVVARLKKLADAARSELGDSATKQKGSGTRKPARI